ncbi:MAG: mechanosensitive ion channel [Bacteroidaceae bacterium]|nr:mechanosensitive ion channel [Bacteroidaceae bacterium]
MENELTSLLLRMGIESENIPFARWVIITFAVILLFYVCGIICHKIIIPLVASVTKRTTNTWDDILLNKDVIKNCCNIVPAVIVTAFMPFIISDDGTFFSFMMKVCWVYITVVGIKLVCSILSALYTLSYASEKTRNHTLKGVFQMLKIAAICIGAIIIVSTLIDRDPVKILAGLGASAAVLMLVFKDSIMGLVAGVQLSANDMMRPGDWIVMPKHGVDGFVIDVSLTTVKIQNWDKTIITVPPYSLVSDSFQNWRGMFDSGGRRVKRSIFIDINSIRFCSDKEVQELEQKGLTGENYSGQNVNLTIFRNYLESYLRGRSDVHPDMFMMARQLQPTAQGLPLELYFFFNGTAWVDYEHFQADIFEYVYAILPEFGLRSFQAPSGSDFNNNAGRIPRHLF